MRTIKLLGEDVGSMELTEEEFRWMLLDAVTNNAGDLPEHLELLTDEAIERAPFSQVLSWMQEVDTALHVPITYTIF